MYRSIQNSPFHQRYPYSHYLDAISLFQFRLFSSFSLLPFVMATTLTTTSATATRTTSLPPPLQPSKVVYHRMQLRCSPCSWFQKSLILFFFVFNFFPFSSYFNYGFAVTYRAKRQPTNRQSSKPNTSLLRSLRFCCLLVCIQRHSVLCYCPAPVLIIE